MPTITPYKYVELDDRGIPVIAGSTMKVSELVLEHTAWNLGPEELLRGHPQLSLAKVHSALAYYFDHQEALDAAIERDYQWVESMRQAQDPSPVVARLHELGLLP